MKFKTYTGITWSLVELTGLLEDEESCVCFEKSKKHFGLHPFHLTNLNTSLNEILSSNLNCYDDELKGFLLAYQNPKLLTPLGEIFYDTCFIHIDVEAEFYMFRPEVGSCIKGIVNKKGVDHIGILVHKAFNVSVPKPDDDENWIGDNLEIDQEVKFVVTLLDLNGKLPFIRGTLNPDNYLEGCKLVEKKFNHKTHHGNMNNVKKEHNAKQKQHTFFDSENSSDDNEVQVKKETPQKRKKSAKRKHLDETETSADDFTTDKYIKNSSKKISKNNEPLNTDTNGVVSNVKMKQKNIEEENFTENEDSIDKKKRKKRSKKLIDISDIKVEPIFNDVIKTEVPDYTDSYTETIEEQVNYDHKNHSKKRDSGNKNLKVPKIKIKKERSISITVSDEDLQKLKVEKVKERKVKSTPYILSDEDLKELKVEKVKAKKEKSVPYILSDEDLKELKVEKVKAKKEKSVPYILSDEDLQELKVEKVKMKKEKFVTNIVSDEEQIDTHNQYVHKSKKRSKSSSRKRSSESSIDLSSVKVKIEKHTDD